MRLAERLDDGLNPLMVKEVRQSFRSGALRVFALLALGIPLVAFTGIATSELLEAPGANRAGYGYFSMVATTLGVVTWVVLPARAGQQFWGEIRSRTIDLIWLTHLSPWELAFGRLQAAVLQIALLFAFTAPYATASTMMGGIDLASVAMTLVALFLVAVLQCSGVLLAVTTSTLAPRLARVAVALVTLWAIATFFIGIGVWADRGLASNEWKFMAWGCGLIVVAVLLCLRLTADMLTRGSQRTYARSKLMLALLVASIVAPLLLDGQVVSPQSSSKEGVMGVACLVLYFFVLCFSASQTRALRISGPLAAPARWLLSDGYDSSFAYAAVLSALLAGLARWSEIGLTFPLLCFLFTLLFSALARLRSSFSAHDPGNPEYYWLIVIALFALDLMLSFGLDHSRLQDLPGIEVFLPATLLSSRGLPPPLRWFALPLGLGLLAASWAHLRFARRGHA